MLGDRMRQNAWYESKYLDERGKGFEERKANLQNLLEMDKPSLETLDQATRKNRLKEIDELLGLERERRELMQAVLDGNAFSLADTSIPYEEIPAFKSKLDAAQKFCLTKEFADSTLERLATPETVVKAKEWFGLAHNPMWLEWRLSAFEKDRDKPPIFGALLEDDGRGGIVGYFSLGIGGVAHIGKCRFYPETLRHEDGRTAIDFDAITGGWDKSDGEPKDKYIALVADFVIRINSPRITDIRPGEDRTALNKKRLRNGKLPLYDYREVDLNKEVKAGLRMSEQGDSGGHRRLHWRRGHFKCCRTGIFWWNPHLAGRRDMGVIEKHYAA